MKTLLVINNEKEKFYKLEKFDEIYYFNLKFTDNFEKEVQRRIKELDNKKFDIIYIKDSLGPTYLDFSGLKFAWYIRLFSKNHKFKPIVILSNLDATIIKKLTFLGDILFTQGVYLTNDFIEGEFISLKEYKNFINLVKVPLPNEYNSNHDLSNDWALYVWAKNFNVNLNKLFKKFEEKFYFQYLKAKYELQVNKEILQLKNQNLKILAIDDKEEWGKIYTKVGIDFYHIQNCEFNEKEIENYDMIILDLRLRKDDYKKEQNINNYCSYSLVEKFLKVNPAIWIIIFSSSKNAELIQEYKKFPNVISYIKKNHPEDNENNLLESIKKFNETFEWIRENKYLKEIWQIKRKIEKILNEININKEITNELKITNELVFYNLTCHENQKKFEYAMLSIYKMLEIIKDYFTYEEKKEIFIKSTKEKIDFQIHKNLNITEPYYNPYFYSTGHKLKALLFLINQKNINLDKDIYNFFQEISRYRNNFIHPNESIIPPTKDLIIKWYKFTYKFLNKFLDI